MMLDYSKSYFIGLVADGTTDVSGKEQFSVCIKYCDCEIKPKYAFFSFYNRGYDVLNTSKLDY